MLAPDLERRDERSREQRKAHQLEHGAGPAHRLEHEDEPEDDGDDALDEDDRPRRARAPGRSPVEEILIPAGGSAKLAPCGYHLMLLDLSAPLVAGEAIELTKLVERQSFVVHSTR